MSIYLWRFGVCTSSTFGSVAVDTINLPRVQVGMPIAPLVIGQSTRSLDGTLRTDRFAYKRTWKMTFGNWESIAESWPVMRMREQYAGPWFVYDHSRPNLLNGEARLMSSWTNAAGSALTVRGDAAVSVAVAGVAQIGPSTSPSRVLLPSVVAGTSYFAAVSVRGAAGWSVSLSVAWFDAAGSAALSTSTLGPFTAASSLGSTLILDGRVSAARVGGSVVAPAGALFAQIRVAVSVAAADVSDPVLLPSPSDPGNALHVVNIADLGETFEQLNTASLIMSLEEV